jgi:hypothetical protein
MKTILLPNIMRLKFLMKGRKSLMKRCKSLMWQQIILFVLFPTEKRGLHSIFPSTTNIKNQGTTTSSTLI